MSSRSSRFRLWAIVAAAGWLFAGSAAADWLVTTEGAAVETRGSWHIQGKLVVFHGADGTFSSMRLTEVDLAASEARTELEAQRASAKARALPPAPAERPKARFVLTDADVGHVEETPLRQPAESAADAESGEAPSPDAPSRESGRAVSAQDNPLEIKSWDANLGTGADGVVVTGVVRNPSEFFASGISIEVTLLDLEGEEIESKSAKPATAALAPGEQSSFRVSFPDVFSVGKALFGITSFNAVVSKPADGE